MTSPLRHTSPSAGVPPSWGYKCAGRYRYGFNGKESDDEVSVEDGSYDFGARMYDARLGRWWSVDPLSPKFASIGTYVFAIGNPIFLVDDNGKEPIKPQVGTISDFVKSIFNMSPSKVGLMKGVDAENALIRLAETKMNGIKPEPTTTPYFNLLPNRYIYTQKGGWIDMVHFLFYAGKAYEYKQRRDKAIKETNEKQEAMCKAIEVCIKNGGTPYWPPVAPSNPDVNLDPLSEAVQDGYFQEALDLIFAPHSAYSYEDLPSDKYGADFAVNYFDPNSDQTLGQQIESYFNNVLCTEEPTSAPNYLTIPNEEPTSTPSSTNDTTIPIYTE